MNYDTSWYANEVPELRDAISRSVALSLKDNPPPPDTTCTFCGELIRQQTVGIWLGWFHVDDRPPRHAHQCLGYLFMTALTGDSPPWATP